jgi:heme exporter protein B
MLAFVVLLLIVATVAAVISVFILDLTPALPGHAILVALVGVIALIPVIVFTSALALRVRARVAVVPILTFPLLVPQLVAATQGMSAALVGMPSEAFAWTGLLAAFALVYAVLGLTIVPAAIE